MALVDLTFLLACFTASWLAWISYSNWIALSNSRVHLVVVKISSVVSPRRGLLVTKASGSRQIAVVVLVVVVKGHDQMNSLVNGSVSAVGLEHSQPCCY